MWLFDVLMLVAVFAGVVAVMAELWQAAAVVAWGMAVARGAGRGGACCHAPARVGFEKY